MGDVTTMNHELMTHADNNNETTNLLTVDLKQQSEKNEHRWTPKYRVAVYLYKASFNSPPKPG